MYANARAGSVAIALLGYFAGAALATVKVGTWEGQVKGVDTKYNIAWIDGENPCYTWVKINDAGDNPCGIDFTLDNGYTYSLANCGDSSFSLMNSDGSYNHQCVYDTDFSGYNLCSGQVQPPWTC